MTQIRTSVVLNNYKTRGSETQKCAFLTRMCETLIVVAVIWWHGRTENGTIRFWILSMAQPHFCRF